MRFLPLVALTAAGLLWGSTVPLTKVVLPWLGGIRAEGELQRVNGFGSEQSAIMRAGVAIPLVNGFALKIDAERNSIFHSLSGKVPWIVRAVWEEHSGWFRYESTTELYTVPPSAIWPELTALAGGTDVLLQRARAHLDAGRPLEALHFVDMVLAVAPDDAGALETKLDALRLLLERSGRENFSEVRWLEAEIRDTEAVLA